ncbi:MAG: sensor domain-containing diguanylate cyclase [Burkholderiales bacterium]|nr:sensor domain-containing diguanylate cyclase [Burkholderiales bacterium]
MDMQTTGLGEAIAQSESERLAALARYRILDTPPDGAFDRVTQLLARLLDVPIAIVSLVDSDRIWFKSHHGLELQQIDREPGLCASAAMGRDLYVVRDARIDPRTLANPLVAGSFGLRFYAAAPLRTRDGHGLGTLCCLDFAPRELSEGQRQILQTLAGVVIDEMELRLAARQVDELHQELLELNEELRRQASHDSLTGLWNRHAIMELLGQARARAPRAPREASALCLIQLDIDHFKQVNDVHGHAAGDAVLRTVAKRLQQALRVNDTVGRVGGEEFLCVLDACGASAARMVAERCREAVCGTPIAVPSDHAQEITVSISVGLAIIEQAQAISAEEAVRLADRALYEAKRGGRNRVVQVGDRAPAAPESGLH